MAVVQPVFAVGREDSSVDQIVERARRSVEARSGGIEPNAFERVARSLHYVSDDYRRAEAPTNLVCARCAQPPPR